MDIFRVVEPGLLTTLQDLGREGFRDEGISEGGAFDKFSLMAANLSVGNKYFLPALEITLVGPVLEVLNDTIVAVAGADFRAQINNRLVPSLTPIEVRCGDVISFGGRQWGCRTYLAVVGGLSGEKIFESYSTDVRIGYGGLKLIKRGQTIKQLKITEGKMPKRYGFDRNRLFSSVSWLHPNSGNIYEIEVIEGPDFDYFYEESYKSFYQNEYEVTRQLDRSGICLQGYPIPRKRTEMLSRPVCCGNIQVTTDGQPIILGVECQTIGGYPRIASVITADFGKLAQLFTGDKVRFRKTDIEKALNKLRLMLNALAS